MFNTFLTKIIFLTAERNKALCIDTKLFHMCKNYLYDWTANSLEAGILCKQI